MATKKLYDISKDEQIILAFQNIKPKPKTQLTAEELITKYRALIKTAIDSGCTYEDICESVLQPNGCDISPRELKDKFTKLSNNKKRPQLKSKIEPQSDN